VIALPRRSGAPTDRRGTPPLPVEDRSDGYPDDHDDRYGRRRSYGHRGHGGLDLHALGRDLLPRLLANKPLLAAVAGAALLLVVLAIWLLVALIGAVGQGGLRGLLEPVVEAARTAWEGTAKPALPR
jgi:hypothetical protein